LPESAIPYEKVAKRFKRFFGHVKSRLQLVKNELRSQPMKKSPTGKPEGLQRH